MENTLKNAESFISHLDEQLGESWSNSTEILAEKLVEYSNKTKNIIIDNNNVDDNKENLILTLTRLQYISNLISDQEKIDNMFRLLKAGGFALIKVEKE